MRDAFAGSVGCERQKETVPRRATVFSTEVRLPVRVAAPVRRGYATRDMTQVAAFRAAMAARQRQVVMIRRFGPPPGRHPYRLRPGAYAVLIRDGQALLTFQHQPEPEFQLPGGGIDPGESPLAALHREVREETGWTIGGARRLGVYRRYCYMPEYGFWAEKLCSIWVARPISRLSAPSEPGHEAHWVALSRAAALLPEPGARAHLRLALRQGG